VIQVYDRHGRPIDTATWEQKLADEEYRDSTWDGTWDAEA
jgi:hypothetical protein